MHARKIVLCAFLAAVAVGAVASAQDLPPKEDRAAGEASLDRELKTLNRKCESKIGATVDWDSFKPHLIPPDNKAQKSPKGYREAGEYCGAVLSGVSEVCAKDSSAYNPALLGKLKNVRCKYVEGSSNKQNDNFPIELKAGLLSVSLDWHVANGNDVVREWLKAHL